MAKKSVSRYLVTVKTNPNFCGADACSVQFAHGCAEVEDPRAVSWFQEHEGYEVKPIQEAAASGTTGVES